LAPLLAVATLLLAQPAGAPPTQAAGGPLRYFGGTAEALDPAYIADAGDVQLLLQLYAGLTRFDEHGQLYASLAEGWAVSDDGTRYTFRLRDGLTFSDGSPLTSADVRRSWLRLLDPTTHATAPDVLGVIRGASEWLAGTGSADEVGISTPDEQTVVVDLIHAASYFPAVLATPGTFVVPRNAVATQDWQQPGAFVGSGPYVAARQEATTLVLTANPNYLAGPPPISEIDWLGDLSTDGVTAFADNQVDLVRIGSGDTPWLSYDADLGPYLHPAAPLSIEYFGFDTTRPPFDDVRVRRAFSLALDRPRLVELAAGASALAASSLVPPPLWTDGPPADVPANPDEARRLLSEAGYPGGRGLGTITVDGSSVDVGPAVAIWRQELGADIQIESMSFGDYLQAVAERPAQIFTVNWVVDYPSPQALYGLLLLPDAASNYGHWNDPTFVQLLADAAGAPDAQAAEQAYRAVEARVDDQAPVIPWAYDLDHWLVRHGLRGLGNLTVGLLDLGRVSWAP
jgi:ABC-type transport system substrate-binding protein